MLTITNNILRSLFVPPSFFVPQFLFVLVGPSFKRGREVREQLRRMAAHERLKVFVTFLGALAVEFSAKVLRWQMLKACLCETSQIGLAQYMQLFMVVRTLVAQWIRHRKLIRSI